MYTMMICHELSTGLTWTWRSAAGQLRLGGVEDERSLRWRGVLQSQAGVVSRQQARELGWPEKTIDRKLRSGSWQRLHPGAYATFTGPPSREARLWAAVLWAGPGAALSHETAAEIHDLTDKPSSKIHISVPARHNPGRPRPIRGVVIHRSRCLAPEWQPPWQLPRTTVEDTILDLIAAARSFDDAYGWISAAVGRRLTTPELLGKALAGRSRMRWRAWVWRSRRGGTGRGRRRPLPAGASLRSGRGACPRPARGAAPGQAQARQREPLPGQPVRGVRAMRRTGRSCGPPGGRSLARHPPRQRQPRAGHGHAEIWVA